MIKKLEERTVWLEELRKGLLEYHDFKAHQYVLGMHYELRMTLLFLKDWDDSYSTIRGDEALMLNKNALKKGAPLHYSKEDYVKLIGGGWTFKPYLLRLWNEEMPEEFHFTEEEIEALKSDKNND